MQHINTRRSFLAALGALAVAATIAIQPASAAEPTVSPSTAGEPTVDASRPAGYYVWHDDRGFHVRTHGPGDDHHFEARLTTDGTFTDVDTVRLESRDSVAVLDGGHTLALKLHTFDATDGVNFRVRGGERIRLHLRLDGELIATDSIYMGANGWHPESNPFTIPI